MNEPAGSRRFPQKLRILVDLTMESAILQTFFRLA